MPYIGSSASPLPVNFAAVQAQSFNGTGSQTAFTLSRTVPSAASIEVLVNNVQQSPYDGSYSVSGTTLTFSEAPSSGTNNVYVVYRDQSLGSLVDESAYRKAEVDSAVAAKVSKAGDTMTGALVVPGLTHTGWGATLDRAWGGFPTITVDNNTGLTQSEFRIHGDPGTAGGDFAITLRVDGKFASDLQTQACSVSDSTAITVATTTPTVIASTTLTTTGKPVLLVATGDGNPNQAGGWHRAQLAIGGVSIGKNIINENAGGLSANCPFALCHIHQPPAGTHTFQLRVWQGSGSFTFGEDGNIQAPTILAVEIL